MCERGTICQLKKLVCERDTICQLKKLVCERGTTCQLKKLVCERGTICQLKVCNRGIEKGKGCDLRGYISVAAKEVREETFVRRLDIDS